PVTDSAGQGREKAGDGLQEGGFAGAVGADQGDPLPPFNPEGETGGQRGGRIVSDRQFPGFQHVLSAGGGDVKTDGRGRAFFGRAFDGLHSLQGFFPALGPFGGGGPGDVAPDKLFHPANFRL